MNSNVPEKQPAVKASAPQRLHANEVIEYKTDLMTKSPCRT